MSRFGYFISTIVAVAFCVVIAFENIMGTTDLYLLFWQTTLSTTITFFFMMCLGAIAGILFLKWYQAPPDDEGGDTENDIFK